MIGVTRRGPPPDRLQRSTPELRTCWTGASLKRSPAASTPTPVWSRRIGTSCARSACSPPSIMASVRPAFSGGTSLSKGWGLIKRFSEDIDFKVAIPAAASRSQDRNLRRGYRERILDALQAAEFELSGEVLKADEDRFFSADFAYPSEFGAGQGLRPHLRVEMTMQPSTLAPVERPIRSLIAELQQQPPEVAAFACVDPVETAADKLSALAWRVCTRQRGERERRSDHHPASARPGGAGNRMSPHRRTSRVWCSKPPPPTPEGEGAAPRRRLPNASP